MELKASMNLKVLGLCGSPIEDSNTQALLDVALKAGQEKGAAVESFSLANKNIEDCRQCNWCLFKQSQDKFCALEDDMAALYPKILEADGLILASPVYLGRLSGRLAAALDRLRALHYGRMTAGALKHKVGGALAVGWYRHSGLETTLMSLHLAFLTFEMLIATPGSRCTFGAAGVSSLGGAGRFDPRDKRQVLRDEFGLATARAIGEAVVELVELVRRSRG